ncbi:MAG: hypothetical protein ACLQU2_13765 [Candidatus Binataceae bacterium]
MKNQHRDDLDKKSLGRLLNQEQLSLLFDLVFEASRLLFDSVAGEGCWESEFTDDQRRTICQRIIVRMVRELFEPEQASSPRPSRMH